MSKVFSLVSNENNLVVLKVNAEDNLTVAMNPYISREYDYITVTKGRNHVLTVVKTDGSTFSFEWGECGHTFISENLGMLKKKVIEFIADNGIMLGINDGAVIREISIYFNSNFEAYELVVQPEKGSFDCYFSREATTLEEMLAEVESKGLVKRGIAWKEVYNGFVGREFVWER